MYRWVWRIVSPRRAGEAARGRGEAAMPKKKAPSERACARLARRERRAIERMPDRGKGCREVARGIGRAPSTVADEAERRRLATSPRALRGEPAPAAGELAARAVARADRGHEARAGARRVHDMPLGGRRVRRDDQHGAEAEGRLRARAQVGAGRGGPALGVRGASRGRLRGRDARARRARPDGGVRGARPRR